ncbi:hypothetical protein XELAEV_18034938mg [Xenopus laevis]|uniref:Uncharacterized protein n=1 Tax=Xenopus laevis TaxID=8355 RepID=A0A974HBN9_XENLA|nr:hypothetical protein XELAEV_18034938mg [Xenopus laevis]
MGTEGDQCSRTLTTVPLKPQSFHSVLGCPSRVLPAMLEDLMPQPAYSLCTSSAFGQRLGGLYIWYPSAFRINKRSLSYPFSVLCFLFHMSMSDSYFDVTASFCVSVCMSICIFSCC